MHSDILGLERRRRWFGTPAEGVRPAQIELQLANGRCLRFDPTLDEVTLTQVIRGGGLVNRAQIGGHGLAVLPSAEIHRLSDQMHDAGLNRRFGEGCGERLSVYTGPDDTITALTDYGIDEINDMLRDARLMPETWHAFLGGFVDDTELVARIKGQLPR